MHQLKISYSGIRGIVNNGLNYNVAVKFGISFAKLIKEIFKKNKLTFVIGSDTRPSGILLKSGIINGLKRYNSTIIDAGIIPSPTLEVMVKYSKADAGVIITASHNTLQWNGFKFLTGPDAIVLNAELTEKLFRHYNELKNFNPVEKDFETVSFEENAIDQHIMKVLSVVDKELIRKKRFSVAVDSGNGAGLKITLALLDQLGCKIIECRAQRDPEPTDKNIAMLSRYVIKYKADIGFAQDMDADRLAVVTEEGEPIGGEYTLALAVRHLLEKNKHKKKAVVKNSSTSLVIDDLCAMYRTKLHEVRVGEVNLSSCLLKLAKKNITAFGGEGNGGIILPKVTYGRDSITGIALILEYLAKRNKNISYLKNELPQYYMIKDKKTFYHKNLQDNFMSSFAEKFKDKNISYADGIKVFFTDKSWCQLRTSNTEPVIRIVAEAKTKKDAFKIYNSVNKLIN